MKLFLIAFLYVCLLLPSAFAKGGKKGKKGDDVNKNEPVTIYVGAPGDTLDINGLRASFYADELATGTPIGVTTGNCFNVGTGIPFANCVFMAEFYDTSHDERRLDAKPPTFISNQIAFNFDTGESKGPITGSSGAYSGSTGYTMGSVTLSGTFKVMYYLD
mmetsp:Transcript_8366/g.10981  ORF Transcript_8366/g.10981 Transcript_8366/m.10981 type:complete len:161 (-) Transcript_8366:120-602(-)|eukprot:CAMPEP_0198144488 /NCGR_PEP_ID=MMETSP1443-20131203/16248_1 /TAXON_ID=186043 /ORGANISM="Entomoneis sp., Strain CCMP2396" /LENGTH=160 /DNA_ID=CAMNT_0043807891 /DNA_START=82 /DNA_END=564 /DNA_ORIENTATION=-